jgi:DNA-directed RNA polymerase subunit M/transcription elongation factor TFIIS
MTQRSNMTLEPIQAIKELVKTLLDNFMDNGGHGDFYDLTKVLHSTKHEDIIRELLSQSEDVNEKAMLSEGLCPECSETLINIHIPATREGPEENFPECPKCHDRYRMVS